ncbi:WD40 domain-containing protein [Cephalotus follicularis]|uniref:WD40 domain-containing protein n=1 Tax=Cephalotus follicularis TaxID=3775 RepID=A0A1Q3CXF4_CEPFO|nr:WD40 domain-containing protein [Cephalotus follicularis]
MENMHYAEELVREFLVFRGFTNTLQAFETELSTDIGKAFQVDEILNLIFSVYIPKFQAEKLVGLLSFFKQCFSSSSETIIIATLSKLEVSILCYYIVYAMQSGRKDKVVEFFGMKGNDLLQRGNDWSPWFALPYVKNPSLDPQFRIFFSKEWYEALRLSVRNFFNEIFNGTRIPTLLKLSSEKNTVNQLKKDIEHLNLKLSQLQAKLEEKEAQLCRSRSDRGNSASMMNAIGRTNSSTPSSSVHEENLHLCTSIQEICAPATLHLGGVRMDKELVVGRPAKTLSAFTSYELEHDSSIDSVLHVEESGTGTTIQTFHDGPFTDNGQEMQGEEEFSEVKVEFQETFLGHTSPISRCRFSASGNNIASASEDGTVRIWTYDSSIPASRNATIYCGAEVMSLDWECKSDRLLLIGTADGGIKAWNVDAKRVVCDLHTTESYPSVLDLKCSPVEPIFVSAAASRRQGESYIDTLGFASLTVWNMKTWKAMTVLPLGEDPPAITSLCFNHNGKVLAASATDGMIHMFDMSAGLQITGWPAHDSAISSILFGQDETSIFSLGSDGKICEWSLQSQGQVLWSRNCGRLFDSQTSKHFRHEMALDATGRRLLVTSGSVRAPIYQVRGHTNGSKTLPHGAAITTVDWHPTLPIFVTGSADHSVRVTSTL